MNKFKPKFKVGDIIIQKPRIFIFTKFIDIPPNLVSICKILFIFEDTLAKERIVDDKYEAGYCHEYCVKNLETGKEKTVLQGDICLFLERKNELIKYYEDKLQFIKEIQ